MKKEDLLAGFDTVIPATLAEQVTSKERNNRTLNSEGVMVGDQITVVGLPDELSSFVSGKNADGTDNVIEFVNLLTEGDRSNLSLGALVGTPKRKKYFAADGGYITEVMEGFNLDDAVRLPQREGDAIRAIAEHYLGTTFECVAVAEGCGRDGQRKFYLWRIVD